MNKLLNIETQPGRPRGIISEQQINGTHESTGHQTSVAIHTQHQACVQLDIVYHPCHWRPIVVAEIIRSKNSLMTSKNKSLPDAIRQRLIASENLRGEAMFSERTTRRRQSLHTLAIEHYRFQGEMSSARRGQSKHGPGSVFLPGETSECPTTSKIG